MKIALLQCDNVLDKFQGEFGNYPEMVKAMFKGVDEVLDFENFDCQQGEYPQDVHAYDLYITTGSKASVYEDVAWIKRLIEFVRQLDDLQIKLFGICFGHQIIALARGGRVEKSDKGWGVGVANNRLIERPDWMREAVDELNILVSHQDQITQLPGDTLIIAESDFCPYFVVQWGTHFLSIQGHPEWKREYSRALMNHRRAIIAAERIETGIRSLSQKPDTALFADWVIDFARQ